MKRTILMLAAVCSAALLMIPEAEARRLGGGRSFGAPRDAVTQRQATPPASAAPAQAAAPASAAAAPAATTMPGGGKQAPAPTASELSPAGAPQPPDEAAGETLRRRWSEFHRLVKQKCGNKVYGALNSAKDTAVGAETVVFAFTEQYAPVREMVDNPETRDQLSRILQQLLGRPFQVVFQTGESAVLPNAAAVVIETKAGDEKDALVDYAVSDLGARVVREGK